MKFRPIPFFLSLVATSTVLFGGWFVYHSMAKVQPLEEIVKTLDGVEDAHVRIDRDAAHIRLKLDHSASLRTIRDTIVREGKSSIGGVRIDMEVEPADSPKLDAIWSNVLFNIAGAMESRHYAEIPEVLSALEQEQLGLSSSYEMDDTNVYLRLVLGDECKYVILPRQPLTLGVWPNA